MTANMTRSSQTLAYSTLFKNLRMLFSSCRQVPSAVGRQCVSLQSCLRATPFYPSADTYDYRATVRSVASDEKFVSLLAVIAENKTVAGNFTLPWADLLARRS